MFFTQACWLYEDSGGSRPLFQSSQGRAPSFHSVPIHSKSDMWIGQKMSYALMVKLNVAKEIFSLVAWMPSSPGWIAFSHSNECEKKFPKAWITCWKKLHKANSLVNKKLALMKNLFITAVNGSFFMHNCSCEDMIESRTHWKNNFAKRQSPEYWSPSKAEIAHQKRTRTLTRNGKTYKGKTGENSTQTKDQRWKQKRHSPKKNTLQVKKWWKAPTLRLL